MLCFLWPVLERSSGRAQSGKRDEEQEDHVLGAGRQRQEGRAKGDRRQNQEVIRLKTQPREGKALSMAGLTQVSAGQRFSVTVPVTAVLWQSPQRGMGCRGQQRPGVL